MSGKYDTAHPLPADSERGRTYNPLLPQIEKIVAVMKGIADSHGVKVAQIPVAWAIAKGTLPIIGVTKAEQVRDAAKAAAVELAADEIKALEAAADEMKLNVIRGWGKEMK